MSTSTTFDIESMLDIVPIDDIEQFDFKTYTSHRKDEELKKIAEEAKQIAEEAKKRELEEIKREEKISSLMSVMKCERRMAEIIIIEAEKVATKEPSEDEDEDEESLYVEQIDIDGVEYYFDEFTKILYDMTTSEEIGKYVDGKIVTDEE